MPAIITTTRKSVETKELQKQAVEDLQARNAYTTEAAIEDCEHISKVAVVKWNNSDIPMSIRQKWQEVAASAAQVKLSLRKLAKIEEIMKACYIIDPGTGTIKKAREEDIYRALDKTPLEQV